MHFSGNCRYESARLVHARMEPLKGKSYENIFVHYMPRSLAWYSDDFRCVALNVPFLQLVKVQYC
jgi:hypothetical protein